MNVTRKNNKSGSVFSFDGDLTIYTVAQAKQALFDDYDSLIGPVALDLRNVSEIDTAGLQLLLFVQKQLAAAEKRVHITKSNEHVDALITHLDVASYFTLEK